MDQKIIRFTVNFLSYKIGSCDNVLSKAPESCNVKTEGKVQFFGQELFRETINRFFLENPKLPWVALRGGS